MQRSCGLRGPGLSSEFDRIRELSRHAPTLRVAADLIASRSPQGQSSWDHVIDAARVEEEGKAEEEEKGAGNTRRHGVRGGERKKFSQRNVPRKASKVTLYSEIVERIRCPEGSQKGVHQLAFEFSRFTSNMGASNFRTARKHGADNFQRLFWPS